MAKRRRCKGIKPNGKRCQRPLKGRQRFYCTKECRVRARGRRRKKYQRDYYQRKQEPLRKAKEAEISPEVAAAMERGYFVKKSKPPTPTQIRKWIRYRTTGE